MQSYGFSTDTLLREEVGNVVAISTLRVQSDLYW